MLYFIGIIVLVAIPFLIPIKFVAIASIVLLACAVVVRTTTSLVTKQNPPFLNCIKAVIYCFIFTIVVSLLGLKLLGQAPLIGVIAVPLIIMATQALVYSATLKLSMGAGAAVSLCVMVVGGFLLQALGFISYLTSHAIH